MLDHLLRTTVTASLTETLGETIAISRISRVAGGDINTCFLMESNRGAFFVKTSSHIQAAAMFRGEIGNLKALSGAAHDFRVPSPVTQGQVNDQAYLVIEALDFSKEHNWLMFGRELARLHRTSSRRFGWNDHNFIGLTRRVNSWSENWCDFWWQCRLLPQFESACQNGFEQPLTGFMGPLQRVTEKLLAGHQPVPSLLHGDLWQGNTGFCRDGLQPALFDPACYYGDRETDIAMTALFGGFPGEFYSAYQQAWPMDAGYSQRKSLYNLYHLFNHLNLFGAGYLQQCIAVIRKLVAK